MIKRKKLPIPTFTSPPFSPFSSDHGDDHSPCNSMKHNDRGSSCESDEILDIDTCLAVASPKLWHPECHTHNITLSISVVRSVFEFDG